MGQPFVPFRAYSHGHLAGTNLLIYGDITTQNVRVSFSQERLKAGSCDARSDV